MKTKKKAKAIGIKKKKRRAYDNRSRRRSSDKHRQQILDAYIARLVKNRGAEVTFKEVAEITGLAERSIYRFFADKDVLHKEVDKYLLGYLQASFQQLQILNVAGFGKNSYKLFDEHESLVLAYIYSPFGQDTRRLFRRKLNQMVAAKIHEQVPYADTPENHKKVAMIISLISAKVWHDIRSDYGYSGAEMGDTLEWALATLIKGLGC